MTKPRKHRSYWGLTLLFSGIVFGVILVSALFASAAVYLLSHLGIITDGSMDSGSVWTVLLFMVLISALVGFLVAFFSCRVPLRPFKRLIDLTNQLASGNYHVRLEFGPPIKSQPFFQELSDSFNTMAAELESAELLRTDFINSFSHEFKTPIVSISGFAKLLKHGKLTEEQRLEYLDIIETESRRLSQMATNVLNLTKVEKQTILTDISHYNLSEQLRTCILLLIDFADHKHLELKADFEEYPITANEELMKQVWINLVQNAIKFAPEYSTVDFRIHSSDGRIRVSITNESETLTPEQQKRIFNKFYQADTSRSTEGTGIGLAIVKRIVDLHQGTVTVHSERNITTFLVTLPQELPMG